MKPSFCYFMMWQVNNCLSYHCSLLALLDFCFVLSTLLSIASNFTTVEWIAKYPLKLLCRRSATKEVLFEWHLRCLSTSIHRCKSNFDKSFTITSPRCERKWRNDATSLCHILCFLAPFSLDSRQYIYKVLFLPWTSLFSCFTGVYNLKGLCYVSLLAIFLTS